MPVSDQDVRLFAHLAKRLRQETYGCSVWDDEGTFVVFKAELLGKHFGTCLELIIGHATDPDARTPGAIKRGYTPEPAKPAPARPAYDPRTTCHDCGQPQHPGGDHPFRSVEHVRSIHAAPAPRRLRDAIQPTRSHGAAKEDQR